MKSKISKILGVGLTVALLVSLLGFAVPLAASTLSWGAEKNPTHGDFKNTIGPAGTDIVDIAVNGDTIFAATNNTTYPLYKSTDGGNTWLGLENSTYFPSAVSVTAVAVASDDPDVVAIVASSNKIYYSSGGGSSWTNLEIPETGATINCIDIAPGTTRYIAVGGANATDAKMYKIKLAMAQSWTEEVLTPATSGFSTGMASISAIKFSPSYVSDKIIVAAALSTSNVSFEVFWDENDKWNSMVTGYEAGYPIQIASTSPTVADIALPSTYIGTDETERIAFISMYGGAAQDGAWRLTDYITKKIVTWASGAVGPIQSVAYHDSGKLLAGDGNDSEAYVCLSPFAATPKFERQRSLKQPGGQNMVVVDWSGDTAVAATSGDESAFAMSTDDGLSWNDVGLIDTTIGNMSDVAPSADGSKVYLVTADAIDTTTNTTDVSVWLKESGWTRVMNTKNVATFNGTVYNDNLYLVGVAPDDDAAVYVAQKGTQNVWVSKDSGKENWKIISCYKVSSTTGLQDMVVQDADTVFILDTAAGSGASKTSNAGSTWGTTKEPTEGINGYMIALAPNGDVLIGGSDGYVAYSKDAGTTFKRTKSAGTGNVHVVADDDYADNNRIIAGIGTSVKKGYATETDSWYTRGTVTATATGHNVGVTGVIQDGAVLYVLTASSNSTYSELWKTLNILEAATQSLVDWSSKTDTGATYLATPRAMKVSSGGKLWAIDTNAASLESFTDKVATSGPSMVGPADDFVVEVNPGSGVPYNVTFTFTRYSSTEVTDAELQIATDAGFDGLITPAITISGITADTIVWTVSGSTFNPGGTYYWRARTTEPVLSPWSETRTFRVDAAIAFALAVPAVGATDVSVQPTFVWNKVEGVVNYELILAEDPTFAIIDSSASPAGNIYKLEDNLLYNTTYYWRVRGIFEPATLVGKTKVPAVGTDWQVGVFTTAAKSAVDAAEPTVIVQKEPAPPAEVTIIEVPVPGPAQAIPSYLLWLIITIGAVLVIALIVLIVRTRRVS